MQMCNNNNTMLKVFEAFDYKDRLWIFLELMDDAMTMFV